MISFLKVEFNEKQTQNTAWWIHERLRFTINWNGLVDICSKNLFMRDNWWMQHTLQHSTPTETSNIMQWNSRDISRISSEFIYFLQFSMFRLCYILFVYCFCIYYVRVWCCHLPSCVQSPPASAKVPKSVSDRKRFFENAMEDQNKPAPKTGKCLLLIYNFPINRRKSSVLRVLTRKNSILSIRRLTRLPT